MAGLRTFIRKNIPRSWEYVLRKEHKLTDYVEYAYQDQPLAYKGKKGYKKGKTNVMVGFNRCPIHDTFKAGNSREGLLYWVGINNKIKDYEYQNR